MSLPKYEIITSKSVYDLGDATDSEFLAFYERQLDALKSSGINPVETSYNLHFFDSGFHNEKYTSHDVETAIQLLAIKDGYDVVRFENGHVGVVAYYSGEENGFEILADNIPDEIVENELRLDNILQFETLDDCLEWFNIYDYQSFKNISDMIQYFDGYIFFVGGFVYVAQYDETAETLNNFKRGIL